MQERVLMIITLVLSASMSDAALIGLRWAETPDQSLESPGGGTVQVWLQVFAGDVIARVESSFEDIDEPDLFASAYASNISGWEVAGIPGSLTQPNSTSWSIAATSGSALSIPGEYMVGTFEVHIGGPAVPLLRYDLYLSVHRSPNGVRETDGDRLTWDARYATFGGYVAYMDWGNPGWGVKASIGQLTPNPLILDHTRVPEPMMICLLAIGGVGIVCRNRRDRR